MTNEHMTRELCRQIRGIAMNYPAGFDAICSQVDGIRALREVTLSPTRREDNQAGASGQTSAAPQTNGSVTQGEKRKPGRPKRVRPEMG